MKDEVTLDKDLLRTIVDELPKRAVKITIEVFSDQVNRGDEYADDFESEPRYNVTVVALQTEMTEKIITLKQEWK